MSKVPVLCRLGIHEVYSDGAILASVKRCNLCPWVESKDKADEVARERALWKHYGEGEVEGSIFTRVMTDFYKGVDPRK